MAEAFDHSRLYQWPINEVEPYEFCTWETPGGLRGGMVTFRGNCQGEASREQDQRVIDWWMGEYVRACGGVAGLVVNTHELHGHWPDALSFFPPRPHPPGFRVLYRVLPHKRERASELWGAEAVRVGIDAALAEMDAYLRSSAPDAEPGAAADGGGM